jgi:curli biogenesis system outer membrane secretion channel CsgG
MAVPVSANESLVKGPAMMDVVTPFDQALTCLDGRINKDVLRFSVGSVIDATGKEQVTDGGSGKFISQGAGDIVQSALFLAGATVVNRRDPRIIDNEVKWGLLDVKQQALSTFFITGSINSLDFLPGSGFDVQIAGLGPRYRQSRILVGLDLSLTETRTGRILANVSLQKQVVATEDGFGIGRFFGNSLVSLDFGGKEREALNLVLRQMLNLATFELLTQVMNPAKYADCIQLVQSVDGVTDNSRSSRNLRKYLTEQAKAAELAAKAPALAEKKPELLDQSAAASAAAKPTAQTVPISLPAATAVTQAADAAPSAAQSPFFGEEKTNSSAAAQQALQIRTPLRTPDHSAGADALVSNGAVLAAVAQATPVKPANNGGCDHVSGEFPQVTPLRATEAGSSLRLRSSSDQVVCLADQKGKLTARPLVAGVDQKFEGTAPWRLQADRMNELDIVFQGLPLRKPSYIKDRMELLERPLAAPAG